MNKSILVITSIQNIYNSSLTTVITMVMDKLTNVKDSTVTLNVKTFGELKTVQMLNHYIALNHSLRNVKNVLEL